MNATPLTTPFVERIREALRQYDEGAVTAPEVWSFVRNQILEINFDAALRELDDTLRES